MQITIANTNKYFKNDSDKKNMIVNAVFSSIKIEGSFTSKKALSQHYDSLNKISKGIK